MQIEDLMHNSVLCIKRKFEASWKYSASSVASERCIKNNVGETGVHRWHCWWRNIPIKRSIL